MGFRFSAYDKFVELGLLGLAENTKDGSLVINAQGPEEALSQFVEWCHRGPVGAKVEGVEVNEPTAPFVPLKNG